MRFGLTRTGNALTDTNSEREPVTVTLIFPADETGAIGVKNHRGALRFREQRDLIAPETLAYPVPASKRRLPGTRSFGDRPYQRPFSRREKAGPAAEMWESGHSGPPRRAERLALAACLALSAGAAGVTAVALHRPDTITAPVIRPAAGGDDPAAGPVLESIASIRETLRGFHAAETPEEKCRYVRGGKKMLPVLRAYYSSHLPESVLSSVKEETTNWVRQDGLTIVYGIYETVDGTLHQYAMEVHGASCLLDWRSLTGWTGLAWNDFLAKQPAGKHAVCVSAVPDNLYAAAHGDPAEWLCLRLEDVTRNRPVWAYLRRHSEAARKLPVSFTAPAPDMRRSAPQRLTLEVSFAADSASPVLEISAVEQGWFERGGPAADAE